MGLDSSYIKLQDKASLPQNTSYMPPRTSSLAQGHSVPGCSVCSGISGDEGVLCGFGLGSPGIVGKPP